MEKSPINEAVGKLIKQLRDQGGFDVKLIASKLHVSQAYLRAIESGARALPAYTVAGLVNPLGLQWEAATALVSMVGYLDTRSHNVYSVEDLLTRITTLRAASPAHYKEVFDLAESLLPANDALASDRDQTQEVVRLKDALASRLSTPTLSLGKKLEGYDLTPVFEDLVDLFADRLAMFPPHVNRIGIAAWERNNGHRIGAVHGFMSKPQALLESFDEFDWAFIWNGRRPTVQILVLCSEREAHQLEAELRKRLLKKVRSKAKLDPEVRDLQDRIHVRPAGAFGSECKKCLLFDFSTRSLPSGKVKVGAPGDGRYKQFENAWIYEVTSNSLLEVNQHKIHVGFLDALDYAVAINRAHVDHWLTVFREASKTSLSSKKHEDQ